LFHVLKRELGGLPFVAENLGVITPEVEAIRKEFGLPGMAILQFAFGDDPQAPTFRPHNYVGNLAAYTGTHDNDTVVGWWNGEGGASTRTAAQVSAEKERARAYLNTDGREINWTFIRTLMSSVANLVVFPAQDIVGLGSEGRMNIPAVPSGNWGWRMAPRALTPEMAGRLKEMSRIYDRGASASEDAPAAS
jgi:4-alpha-glucanotransferase